MIHVIFINKTLQNKRKGDVYSYKDLAPPFPKVD